MGNTYKKQDANGNQLAEEIGKGIDELHQKKVLEARKNDATYQFRTPTQLKEDFNKVCENPSEVLRSLMRGYVNHKKQKLKISKTVNPL